MVRVSPLCVVQFAAVAAAAYVLLNTSFLDNILNNKNTPPAPVPGNEIPAGGEDTVIRGRRDTEGAAMGAVDVPAAAAVAPEKPEVVQKKIPGGVKPHARYDASVKLVPLGEYSQRTSEKRQLFREHEKDRHNALDHPDEAAKKQGYKNCKFNQYVSDQISLHRVGRDTRERACHTKEFYPAALLPPVSVIIVFYNEARSTLLRTVWSALDRSPANLIHEIILVDDGSDRPHLKEELEKELENIPKTKVVRMPERGGLIRAKVFGVEHSSGEVLVFIDSHCECNDGWLEPLLSQIVKNRKTIAMPIIDVIDMDTFEVKQAIVEKGVFSWTLYFYWLAPRGHILEKGVGHYGVDPMTCPTMAGGIFAIDRDYFYESGAYDMGQDTWGGENIEMSFRLWMCGGTLEIVPCSRISHVFRAQSPYTFKDRDPGKTIAHNLNRVAEVWMDDYAPIYYNLTGNRRHGFGDITERKKFRREHNCKSFKWYVEEIAPYMFAPLPGGVDYRAAGQLQNVGNPKICVAPDSGRATKCRSWRANDLEPWYHSKKPFDGQIRHEISSGSKCLKPDSMDVGSKPHISLVVCYDNEKSLDALQWVHDPSTRQLKARGVESACMTFDQENKPTILSACDPNNDQQKWEFVKLPYRT